MARNKTEDIRLLVEDVLDTMKPPWPEDITYRVCKAIENNQNWYARYKGLLKLHHPDVVHCWIGQYTSNLTGLKSSGEVKHPKDTFIKSFKLLG